MISDIKILAGNFALYKTELSIREELQPMKGGGGGLFRQVIIIFKVDVSSVR